MFNLTRNNRTSTALRAVGFLLVLFIFYGTTVEAAHVHGRFVSYDSKSASVVETGSADSSVGTKLGCNDCLICQLHQNFSATAISIRPAATALTIQSGSQLFDRLTIQSRINTPHSGRAPPQVN
jgi:hypothetical protein